MPRGWARTCRYCLTATRRHGRERVCAAKMPRGWTRACSALPRSAHCLNATGTQLVSAVEHEDASRLGDEGSKPARGTFCVGKVEQRVSAVKHGDASRLGEGL
jgi:hypothetical protein